MEPISSAAADRREQQAQLQALVQETLFRRMLRRNLDANLKLSESERERSEYVPKSLQPPDWR